MKLKKKPADFLNRAGVTFLIRHAGIFMKIVHMIGEVVNKEK